MQIRALKLGPFFINGSESTQERRRGGAESDRILFGRLHFVSPGSSFNKGKAEKESENRIWVKPTVCVHLQMFCWCDAMRLKDDARDAQDNLEKIKRVQNEIHSKRGS